MKDLYDTKKEYYHGMGPKELVQKWYRDRKNDAFGSMFEYRNKTKTFTHPKWEFLQWNALLYQL